MRANASTPGKRLPDGSTCTVVVQSIKSGKGGFTLALLGEAAPPF
jgi:hypothetical protein